MRNNFVFIGDRPKFVETPWYLKILGFKKWRRKEIVRVLIIYEAEKWIYYDDKEKAEILETERKEDSWKKSPLK